MRDREPVAVDCPISLATVESRTLEVSAAVGRRQQGLERSRRDEQVDFAGIHPRERRDGHVGGAWTIRTASLAARHRERAEQRPAGRPQGAECEARGQRPKARTSNEQ